jgi:predicted enzyme related to lactoylglutathione lyase
MNPEERCIDSPVHLTTPKVVVICMTEPITGLHAVSLHITDINRARIFYKEVLGLRELSFDEKLNRLVFALPGTSAILTMHIMAPNEGGREPGTVSGIVFSHPDPQAACAEIKKRGGAITLEPVLVEVANAKFYRGVFADPDGNEFLISDRKD